MTATNYVGTASTSSKTKILAMEAVKTVAKTMHKRLICKFCKKRKLNDSF